jgi:hypothetical protein
MIVDACPGDERAQKMNDAVDHPLQPIKNSLMKTLVLQDLIFNFIGMDCSAVSIGNGLERHDSSPLGWMMPFSVSCRPG